METMETQQIQQAWNNIAEGYDNYITPIHDDHFTRKLLNHAGLKSGMSFLDVASGSGALTIPAARMGAKVTAVDLAPNMIKLLNERAQKEGLKNVNGLVMDGHDLDLADNSFDVSGSQFGVMLFPDLPKGLKEMVRVTKKGGTVLIISFRTPDKVDFINYFFTALQIVLPDFQGLPKDPLPQPFQVSDPDILYKRMEEAGLNDIEIIHEIEEFKCPSGIELWKAVMSSNPLASQVTSGISDEQKSEVQLTLEHMIRDKAAGKEFAILRSELNVGVGKV